MSERAQLPTVAPPAKKTRTLRAWRGDQAGGKFIEYTVQVDSGMVVLDLIHRVQAEKAGDLACRWNCKAGKCGSCSMEINGKPRLSCMTRLGDYADGEVTVQPMKAFPVIKDLVTDVSWNYEQNKRIKRRSRRPRARPTALPDDAGGRGPDPGVPEVHRVLPVPGRLPRGPRPRQARSRPVSGRRASSARGS
jgi:hypothetical protein